MEKQEKKRALAGFTGKQVAKDGLLSRCDFGVTKYIHGVGVCTCETDSRTIASAFACRRGSTRRDDHKRPQLLRLSFVRATQQNL